MKSAILDLHARAFARAEFDIWNELGLAIERKDLADPEPTPVDAPDLFVSDLVLEPYAANAFNLAGAFSDELLSRGRGLVQERLASPNYDPELLEAEISTLFEDRFSDARLENIARTEFSKAYNAGRNDLITSPEVAGIVEGVQYSAVMDDRTTDYCAAWDGVVVPIADTDTIARNGPPAHYQCRSMWVPVTIFDEDIKATPVADRPSGNVAEPMAGFGSTGTSS